MRGYIIPLLLSLSFLPYSAIAATACNNAPALCNRPYNKVVHLGAHDSPFIRNKKDHYSPAGDQFYGSITQLEAGVRLLTAQVHKFTTPAGATEWHLCHTYCFLYDAGTLTAWLAGIKTWLDNNVNEVVTILLVNSDNASASILGTQFSNSGIVHYAYTPPETTHPTTSWPTLNQMITSNKRLVAFIASLDPTTNTAAPYLLDEFTFAFENNYNNVKPSDFSCTANRPSFLNGRTAEAIASGRMPLMNHFRYDNISGIEISAQEHADSTNSPGFQPGNLGLAGRQCTKVYGKPPTFIIVDFFNVGPAIATVDRLNNVTGTTVGRKALPTTVNGTINDPNSGRPAGKTATGSLTSTSKRGTGANQGSTQRSSVSSAAPAPASTTASKKNAAVGMASGQMWAPSQVVAFAVVLPLILVSLGFAGAVPPAH